MAAMQSERQLRRSARDEGLAERHLWMHEPRGYGWSCHSQIYGTGCTQPATWRHGTAPHQYLATYWCEQHKPMAEG